jgi:putative ABC transport system permease protein
VSAFAVQLARRELRAGWRHFAGLVVCVALGVAALVGVGGVGASLQTALSREGRSLMGGDLELRSQRALGDSTAAALARLAGEGARLVHVREMVAMARDERSGATLLVELKAVSPEYPLYGRLDTRPSGPVSELLAGEGVLVEEALLTRLGLRVGAPLVLGQAAFTITGIIIREPDRVGGLVSLGPRVLIADSALERTGLVTRGSRVRHRALVQLPPSVTVAAVRESLGREVDDPAVRISAYDEAQPGLRRFFTQLTSYLGLVGLASLLVGGIGVASAVRTFVRRRRESLAILKCLGAERRQLLAAYLLQALVLGLTGSLLGAMLGLAAQPLAARALMALMPLPIETTVDPATLLRAVATGVLMTVLVAGWPLLAIRDVPAALILRDDAETTAMADQRRPWLLAFVLVAVLSALAVWQAGSLKLGAIFVGGAALALALLALMARGLAALARRRPGVRSLAWRQGVANLGRPGGHAAGVIVAMGVGVMLLVAVGVLEASLGRQIDHERRREAPSFFFVDVQPDQRGRLEAIVRAAGAAPTLTPVVRARLAAVGAEPVTRAGLERRRQAGHEALWYFTRDYVLTAAADLPAGNVVTHGRWWRAGEKGARLRASVEEMAARHLGVAIGDTLTFDVQGVSLEAEVVSIRRVDWQTLSANFFVILSPGALDGAPTTFVATARVPAAAEAQLQDSVVAALPNVTAVPLRDVLERVGAVLDQIALAIRVIAVFSVAAGLVVMVGALAASRWERLRESVILRTLGATRGAVARIFAVEYACLGAAAGLGGSALASLLAWVVLRFVLDAPWALELPALLTGMAAATLLALAVGFLATFRLLGQKPLPVLRRE